MQHAEIITTATDPETGKQYATRQGPAAPIPHAIYSNVPGKPERDATPEECKEFALKRLAGVAQYYQRYCNSGDIGLAVAEYGTGSTMPEPGTYTGNRFITIAIYASGLIIEPFTTIYNTTETGTDNDVIERLFNLKINQIPATVARHQNEIIAAEWPNDHIEIIPAAVPAPDTVPVPVRTVTPAETAPAAVPVPVFSIEKPKRGENWTMSDAGLAAMVEYIESLDLVPRLNGWNCWINCPDRNKGKQLKAAGFAWSRKRAEWYVKTRQRC